MIETGTLARQSGGQGPSRRPVRVMSRAGAVDGSGSANEGERDAPEARVGVDQGFDAFCRREYAGVIGLGYALTGNLAVAQDLAQDAFLAAFRTWDTLQAYDDPGAWVRRVVANRAVSWRRRISSEARALVRLTGRRAPGAPHDEIPERDAELWALVRKLPPRQAQVFALTYVEDLSLDQVAAVLDISAGTAKTHLKRARSAIVSDTDDEAAEPGSKRSEDVEAER